MNRSLEITLISGKNLRLHKKPVKNAVVAVRVEHGCECLTRPVPDKGTNPEWNENLVVDLPLHAGFITVEVKCKSSSGSYKLVGGATVPVSDFTRDSGAPEGYVHFLSYSLRDSNGVRTDGIVNISAKLAAPALSHTCEVPRPEIGVPVGDQRKIMVAGGLVTGVPVWYAQRCRC
ncbi:C2 domain-containing protein [Psidium guajava]|nr:C2 domain-containing protein [Psidium guajava]